MLANFKDFLEIQTVEASAPCRIDMGGTLDISTFYFPLRHLKPCTFNIAINLRTQVRLLPYQEGMVKVSSKGFESAAFPIDNAPFYHPLGLMFSVAAYFRAQGIHIDIDSSSPPRSGLGGSSAAAVALIAAISNMHEQMSLDPLEKQNIALLAHRLEGSVAGVPCGLQDQLAAVFGGVNAWYWPADIESSPFTQKTVVGKESVKDFEQHLLLAYCGVPHESKNINSRWVRQFLSGRYCAEWVEIAECTQMFVEAISDRNFKDACVSMNREIEIRRKMTPEVLDTMGEKLVNSAIGNNCSARFTGAGGGGCIWAIGEVADIDKLKGIWERDLSSRKDARIIEAEVDFDGVASGI